jgi:hypothetical protein
VVRFIREYKRAFRKHRGNTPLPPVFRRDLERLTELLATHSWEMMADLLECFFESEAAFIRRRDYGLGTFAASINILQALRSKPKTLHLEKSQTRRYSGPGSVGAWTKASEITAGEITK